MSDIVREEAAVDEAKHPGAVCSHCDAEIFAETDDLITCGGMYPVWYSKLANGKRQMSCFVGELQTHEPPDRLSDDPASLAE